MRTKLTTANKLAFSGLSFLVWFAFFGPVWILGWGFSGQFTLPDFGLSGDYPAWPWAIFDAFFYLLPLGGLVFAVWATVTRSSKRQDA